MVSQGFRMVKYGLQKDTFNTSWVVSKFDEWFNFTTVSYYIQCLVLYCVDYHSFRSVSMDNYGNINCLKDTINVIPRAIYIFQ